MTLRLPLESGLVTFGEGVQTIFKNSGCFSVNRYNAVFLAFS